MLSHKMKNIKELPFDIQNQRLLAYTGKVRQAIRKFFGNRDNVES